MVQCKTDCGAIGTLTRVAVRDCADGVAADSGWLSGDRSVEVLSESLKRTDSFIDVRGLSGSRSRLDNTLAEGQTAVAGSITMAASAKALNLFGAYIFGGAPTGTTTKTFHLGNTLPLLDVFIDRQVSSAGATGIQDVGFAYGGLGVTKATVAGSQNGPVTLTLDLIGKTYVPGVAFPDVTVTGAADFDPYVFADVTFNNSMTGSPVEYEINSFNLVIDNLINPRYGNNLLPQRLCPRDRKVTLGVQADWSATWAAIYDKAPAAGFITLDATYDSVFSFSLLKWPNMDPETPGPEELPYAPTFEVVTALKTTNEITLAATTIADEQLAN